MKEFRSNIVKKEETLANKTIALIEKTIFDNFLLIDMIVLIHEYVYKFSMVISN